MNHSSCFTAEDGSVSRTQSIISVNVNMALLVLASLCNISAKMILFRRALRGKIMAPFMINLTAISLVQSTFGYTLTLGIGSVERSSKGYFLCRWVAFTDLFSQCAYSFTLCAMNVVSKLASDRCFLGASQQITKKSKGIFFTASWLCSIAFSSILLGEESLSVPSASKRTCHLDWASQETHVFFFNLAVILVFFLLPLSICSTIQYFCSRIWKNSRNIADRTRRRGLAYRRKSNRMVIALTLCFFVSQLPLCMANIITMTTGCYSYQFQTAFILELLAKSSAYQAPLIYAFLNASYRNTLKQILMGSHAAQTRPGARPVGNNPREGMAATKNCQQGRRPHMLNNKVDQSPKATHSADEQLNGMEETPNTPMSPSST